MIAMAAAAVPRFLARLKIKSEAARGTAGTSQRCSTIQGFIL
jgi:hypothetical protein